MDVKIEPRKKSDRGGYLMMPLLKNVPIAPRASWKLMRCPVCGAKCWDRPYPEGWEENVYHVCAEERVGLNG